MIKNKRKEKEKKNVPPLEENIKKGKPFPNWVERSRSMFGNRTQQQKRKEYISIWF